MRRGWRLQQEKDRSAGWPWRLKEASGGREETYCSLQSEHLRGSPQVTRPGTLRPRGEADYTGQENPAWWTVPGQIRNALLEKRGQATGVCRAGGLEAECGARASRAGVERAEGLRGAL